MKDGYNGIQKNHPMLFIQTHYGSIIFIWVYALYCNIKRCLIYTIKTQGCICVYMCIYVCIYLFVCSELIEETGRFPNVIFGI